MKTKKSQEGVIATVLLIMLTIAAASMLFIFVVPWIRGMMEKGKICSDAQDQIRIDMESNSCGGHMCTCYNSTDTRIMIARGEKRDLEIEGISIALIYSGTSEKFDIKENETTTDVAMYNGGEILRLPDTGGSETYIFKRITGTERATAALIFSGNKVCEAVSEQVVSCDAVG